jgi:serine protease inhibitor
MNGPADPRQEITALAARLSDGEMTAQEAGRLEQLAGESEEGLRYLLDYLQLHGELYWEHGGAAQFVSPPAGPPEPRRAGRRWQAIGRLAAGAAVAAAALAAVAVWHRAAADRQAVQQPELPRPEDEQPIMSQVIGSKRVRLAAGWRIEPTGDADYRVVAPDRVRLERGEILVEAAPPEVGSGPGPLSVETPAALARAVGRKFFIGTCLPQASQPGTKAAGMSGFTRVLVLSGIATLVNAQGSVRGENNHLLAAEAEKAPAACAVEAGSGFALALHSRLAALHPDENLCFSPYSLSAALAMVAEGARGKTAEEMGRVLHFPAAARHVGADAQLIPWNVALIHSGMAAIQQRLAASQSPPKELLDRIAALRKQSLGADIRRKFFELAGSREQAAAADRKAVALENERNELLAKIDPYELRLANALWGDKAYPFRQAYLDTINKYYQTGGIFPVDFQNDYAAAVRQINAWVGQQTRGRIVALMPPATQPADPTALVLTNAVYFKGAWREVFESARTAPADFTLAGGQKVRVPMMNEPNMESAGYAAFNGDGSFFPTPAMYTPGKTADSELYPDDRGFAMLRLPYKGGELSMVVIVPRSAERFTAIEKMAASEHLAGWLGKLEQRETQVSLPRFRLESKYDMQEALRAMGMSSAFDPAADLSGMSAAPLHLGTVLHKAFVAVNETGTEAAATTLGAMGANKAGPGARPFVPIFRADKPFLFLIRDKPSGIVLFLGRLVSPK